MEQTTSDFFHDFRQELMAGAEAHEAFQLSEFMEAFSTELIETGFIEGFELCHYRAQRGMRVDGYWFNDEGALDLFIADFDNRDELQSLTQTEVSAAFRRLENFFEASLSKHLFDELEETTPEYGLSRQISDRRSTIRRVNFFLVSERVLSDRMQSIENRDVCDTEATFHVWDVSRLQRQRSSRDHKEALNIDFKEEFGRGLNALPAHLGSSAYQSFLIVMPGQILSKLYEKHGARLLEQNVRSFLQARGKVNKGIRTTILNEPEMFFAYNNGITATAQEVDTVQGESGLAIVRIRDLQIVNGGQTTASLFHTSRREKIELDGVFVQMKLSVIGPDQSELVVPKISEYANTQNRVNAADFFSNHPFHVRLEEFSRRIWAPARSGEQRESKWFYERARGQYADAQSKMTTAEKKRFKLEYPKAQMFTKTDLAKFENVWDEVPRWVNLGAQKNFARYAQRIGKLWEKDSQSINEFYFRRIVARAILFRNAEKLVSAQAWYDGGYRANIVAYTLACVSHLAAARGRPVDFEAIWRRQDISATMEEVLRITARFVNDYLRQPPAGVSNISEWAKQPACWDQILEHIDELSSELPSAFDDELVDSQSLREQRTDAKKLQRLDDGINAQQRVVSIPAKEWKRILVESQQRNLLSEKEASILRKACKIPAQIPTEGQSKVLISMLARLKSDGITVDK